jgi:hypothetical protein
MNRSAGVGYQANLGLAIGNGLRRTFFRRQMPDLIHDSLGDAEAHKQRSQISAGPALLAQRNRSRIVSGLVAPLRTATPAGEMATGQSNYHDYPPIRPDAPAAVIRPTVTNVRRVGSLLMARSFPGGMYPVIIART